MLVIRANANPPINENDPKDAISLLSYLNREQYGTWPLAYGAYYNAPKVDYLDGNPVYAKDNKKGKYVIVDDRKGTVPVPDPRFETIFPRMWSNQKPAHIELYKKYGGAKGTPIRVDKPDGTSEVLYKPTFGENLKFFFTYQIGHMYLRYFMWNFVGRQNDIESQGEIQHGNWISGINFIDNWRLGNQDIPSSMKNPARATFFFLPFILGLLGFFFQFNKDRRDTWVVFLLFIMTGLAIIVYLNQTPLQPRERDYAYAGSFYAFAIWIGFGVLALFDLFQKYITNKRVAAASVTLLGLLAAPVIMGSQGWEAHDRSGKYAALDFARMYLESCEPDAILFTNGDNDTFPLWYAQEVEGIRTDVRVVNYMLSSGEWYVDQMFRKAYESDPLPLSLSPEFYNSGENNALPVFVRIEDRTDLGDVLTFVKSKDKGSKMPLQDGTYIDYIPVKKLKLKVDPKTVLETGTVSIEDSANIVTEIDWDIKQNALYRNDLMLLDLVATNNWERPIYFANPSSIKGVFNVDKYCHQEGIVYRFKPTPAAEYIKNVGGVDADRTYEVLMADDVRWGRLNEPDVTVDRESARTSGIIKQNYLRLAQTLADQGKNDSVVEVLDRGIYFFPNYKFPFDYYMIPWVDLYYRAGAKEKGKEMLVTLSDIYTENLAYYASDARFSSAFENEIQESLAVMQRLGQMAKENHEDELADQIDQTFKDYMTLMNYN